MIKNTFCRAKTGVIKKLFATQQVLENLGFFFLGGGGGGEKK
jgi:hypothetical protein